MRSVHYIHTKLKKVKNNLEQPVPRRSTRSPYPLRVVTSLGSLVNRTFVQPRWGRDPAHCDPAGGSAGSLFFCKCDKKLQELYLFTETNQILPPERYRASPWGKKDSLAFVLEIYQAVSPERFRASPSCEKALPNVVFRNPGSDFGVKTFPK